MVRKKRRASRNQTRLRQTGSYRWAFPAALLAAGTLVYINSFHGIFIFDDLDLPKNLSIRTLWPPWDALFGPLNVSRPLIGLSLAVNYAISGLDVWSYHLFNLIIHLITGLTLFGVVRRTLLNPRLSERFGRHATALALAIALIWLVHPLQTQSVTYIIQRCESLMGMFYLLTLYCVIRGSDSPRSRRWYVAAVAACAAGMLSKQVMVTAPIVVLIYDFLFLSGSLSEALRKRAPLYAGLALTWAVLAAPLVASPSNPTAGFAVSSITPWAYFKSEFSVVVHYIRLAIWPASLCLDYAWPRAASAAEVIPYALPVGGLGLATAWALWKRWPVSFLGVWFFGILSPTSTFMPFVDLAFEHRMYLPLASAGALAILGGYSLVRAREGDRSVRKQTAMVGRVAMATLALAIPVLGLLTVRRNNLYNDGVAMWSDVVSKRPENPRAYDNLATFLAQRGNLDQASDVLLKGIQLDPSYAPAHQTLGMILVQQGRLDDAILEFTRVVEIDPNAYEAYTRLGAALANQHKLDQAVEAFSKALSIEPHYGPSLADLGFAQEGQGKSEEAIRSLDEALRHLANSELSARIHLSLGNLLSARGQETEAAAHYAEALRLKPDLNQAQQRLKQVSR